MIKAQRSIPGILFAFLAIVSVFALSSAPANAQALSAGTVSGVTLDPNGAVVPSATVIISNPITGYKRTTNTDTDGSFRFSDVPPNNYQLTVEATGFSTSTQT